MHSLSTFFESKRFFLGVDCSVVLVDELKLVPTKLYKNVKGGDAGEFNSN